MAVRVIYYTNEDLIEHGDLALRRKSVVLKESAFEYEKLFRLEEQKHGWIFTPLQVETQPLFHDEQLISGPMEVKNGFCFNSSDTFYKLIAEFPKAALSKKTKLFSLLTALVVALILVAETLLVIWLPKQLDDMSNLSQKIIVQQCESDLDQMRGSLRKWKGDKKTLSGAAVVFVLRELNRVADYFRANRELFTMDEVNVMRRRLDNYRELVDKLKQGVDFDKKVIPDVEGWIERNCKIEE